MHITFIDTETSGKPEQGAVLMEVAVATYSLKDGLANAASWLVAGATENHALAINGIQPWTAATFGYAPDLTFKRVENVIRGSTAVVAHGADFDRQWFPASIQNAVPWCCSCYDMPWARVAPDGGRKLVEIALAYGIGIARAHRALDDVLTLAALFDRAKELGEDIEGMLREAMRPKTLYVVTDTGFSTAKNAVYKQHLFAFKGPGDRLGGFVIANKGWYRAAPDAPGEDTPFEWRKVEVPA